jgi:hypothetical protein
MTKRTAIQRRQHSRDLVRDNTTDLPLPEDMFTKEQFRSELMALYRQRQWYRFTLGLGWFNRQVERLIQDWTQSGGFDCDNDWEMDRIIWECTCEELAPYLPELQ